MTGWSRRRWLAGTATAGLLAATRPVSATSQGGLPWYNWSGSQSSQPISRFAPGSEDELVQFLRTTNGAVRPVGAGHSFSPLVPTDGHLVVLDRMAGLLEHNSETVQATFAAGTRLGSCGALLEPIGQAMFNLPDIDRQTLAGATSTATHGTGIGFNTLSGYITGLRLVTATGEVLDIDAENNSALFDAARAALGALGIVTQIRMQNRTPYRLKERNWVERTETVLEHFDESARAHRHFEMFPLVHSDYALVLAIDETIEPINNPRPSPEEAAAFGQVMKSWLALPPGKRKPLINGLAEGIEPSEAVDVSHKILANVRNNRFNEMEYSVPIEAGAQCLREILATIERQAIDVVFPLEFRYIKGDDLWLSMFSGGDRAAISIHRAADFDYRPYFDAIEPIFWKYDGRPHWGKCHTLEHAALSSLYPRLADFINLRAELDPSGRFLNDHLRKIFGIES